MHDLSTGGRRGIAAAVLTLLLATSAACGTATATDDGSAVPGPPAATQAPAGISADTAERQGAQKSTQGTSADAAERRGNPADPTVSGRQVPDALP